MEYLVIISLVVSFISLYVAARVAWETTFAPPKLVSVLTQIYVLGKFGNEERSVVMRAILPSLQIRNIGAKIVLIENVRLAIQPSENQSEPIYSYPESKISIDKILNDRNQYHDSGHDSFPVNLDEMFTGFSLMGGESWHENFSYTSLNEKLKGVSGKTRVDIEVKERNVGWTCIHSSIIDFGECFNESPDSEGFIMSICRSIEYEP